MWEIIRLTNGGLAKLSQIGFFGAACRWTQKKMVFMFSHGEIFFFGTVASKVQRIIIFCVSKCQIETRNIIQQSKMIRKKIPTVHMKILSMNCLVLKFL